jgi:hypothetical protein
MFELAILEQIKVIYFTLNEEIPSTKKFNLNHLHISDFAGNICKVTETFLLSFLLLTKLKN